jgi:hypothetical protein
LLKAEPSTAAIVVHHPLAIYFSIHGPIRERPEQDVAEVMGMG